MKTVVDQSADIGEVLLTEDQIQTRIAELGLQISNDMAGR
jgi:hypoxanthine-guanine phosphoribosyltransferase